MHMHQVDISAKFENRIQDGWLVAIFVINWYLYLVSSLSCKGVCVDHSYTHTCTHVSSEHLSQVQLWPKLHSRWLIGRCRCVTIATSEKEAQGPGARLTGSRHREKTWFWNTLWQYTD
jgi:hypothetical protein